MGGRAGHTWRHRRCWGPGSSPRVSASTVPCDVQGQTWGPATLCPQGQGQRQVPFNPWEKQNEQDMHRYLILHQGLAHRVRYAAGRSPGEPVMGVLSAGGPVARVPVKQVSAQPSGREWTPPFPSIQALVGSEAPDYEVGALGLSQATFPMPVSPGPSVPGPTEKWCPTWASLVPAELTRTVDHRLSGIEGTAHSPVPSRPGRTGLLTAGGRRPPPLLTSPPHFLHFCLETLHLRILQERIVCKANFACLGSPGQSRWQSVSVAGKTHRRTHSARPG